MECFFSANRVFGPYYDELHENQEVYSKVVEKWEDYALAKSLLFDGGGGGFGNVLVEALEIFEIDDKGEISSRVGVGIMQKHIDWKWWVLNVFIAVTFVVTL